MAISQADLDDFNQFAQASIDNGAPETMAELFDLWLLKQPADDEQAETIRAIQEGLDDAKAGRVRPFEDVNSELLRRHGWSHE